MSPHHERADVLHELVDMAGDVDPDELHRRYREALAAVVETVGTEAAATETGLDPERLEGLRAGDADLSVSDAAAVLALDRDPDAEAIRQESLDHLLLGMTQAVLDVDAVAANLALERSATEIQQRIEGRVPMTLREFAHLEALIASRTP